MANKFLELFKKKKVEKRTDGVVFHYDIRPWVDLKYNLIYAHAVILFEDDKILVMARKYKKNLIKYVIVLDFEHYKTVDVSNERLIELNKGKEFEYGFSIEDLNIEKHVLVTIFKENNEETKAYCIEHTKTTKTSYEAFLVFDESCCRLYLYNKLRNFGPLFEEYQNAMYMDIKAIDPEEI